MRSAASVIPLLASYAAARTFTVKNSCSFTIWPAVYTDPNVGHSKPDVPTGWEAAPGSSRSFNVPNDWKSGRIWGRTDCDAKGNCASGSCAGGIECDPNSGTGATPASLAEWTLDSSGNNDFYDVSLVDGYNLPMAITNSVGCPMADCAVDLLPSCPSQLRTMNSSGTVVGCKSSCGWDGNTYDSGSCCTGSYGTPETCPSSGVKFYSFFKESCRNSYVFAYDEASGTALWSCNSGKAADYTLTFCPHNSGANAHSPSAQPEPATTHSSSAVAPSRSDSISVPPRVLPVSTSTVSRSSPPAAPSVAHRHCKRHRRTNRRRFSHDGIV